MSPYKLPDGNVQISFSGGRTSGYMLHQILEANGDLNRNNVRVVFSNTGREMPETLDFVQEVQDRWGVVITWVELDLDKPVRNRFRIVSHNSAARNGEPFEALIAWKRILPNTLMRFCTRDLKVWPARDYLLSLNWAHWTNTVGLRADEAHRAARKDKNTEWTRWHPLIDAGATKDTIANFWKSQPFDLRLEMINGSTPHSNCDGCFLKSELKLAELAKRSPERFEWWAQLEDRMSAERGNYGYFNKDRPMRQLQDFVDRQGDWIFDAEDALCQADGGECTG